MLNSDLFFFLGGILPVSSAICIGAFFYLFTMNFFFNYFFTKPQKNDAAIFAFFKTVKTEFVFFLGKIKSGNRRTPSTHNTDLILHAQIGRSERRAPPDGVFIQITFTMTRTRTV